MLKRLSDEEKVQGESLTLESDYMHVAAKVFKDADWIASEDEVRLLAKHMLFFENRGLRSLNQRLSQGGRKILDTIAEHNVVLSLISHHPVMRIEYEPNEGFRRPTDFKLGLDGVTYRIQVKNLARLARENKQRKLFQQVEARINDIKIGKFLDFRLSDDFDEKDIPTLMEFISDKAHYGVEGQEFYFPETGSARARVSFILPKEATLPHLVLGLTGDMDMVEVTGLSEDQIKGSLRNAAEAFELKVSGDNINLIVVEADREKDIHVCAALYGTGFIGVRGSNGLFCKSTFSEKVAGVIVARRKERRLICECVMLLYMNTRFSERIGDITKLLSFDKIIYPNMFPPSNRGGNF